MKKTTTIDKEKDFVTWRSSNNMYILWYKYISKEEDIARQKQVNQAARFKHRISQHLLHTFQLQNNKHGPQHKILFQHGLGVSYIS